MGYYVTTREADFFIDRKDFDTACNLLKNLNRRDDLKSGGVHPADLERPEHSKSVAKNPNVWFAWMPWNYDELFDDPVDILREVGFDVTVDETGIIDICYDSKTGCEGEFLRALAPVVRPGSYIVWEGEEYGDIYRYDFDGRGMETTYATIEWE